MNDNNLDGKPESFPLREFAKVEYRTLWISYLLLWDRDKADTLSSRMEELQDQICLGPGPMWQEFANSLPEFSRYWNRVTDEYEAMIESRDGP